MKVKKRPLNKGECFACSIKKTKEIFQNTSVVLDFAYYGSRVYGTFARTPDRFYVEKKIKGVVVSVMYMHPQDESPLLSFFVLKKERFTDELMAEFENKYLYEYYNFYQSLLMDTGMYATYMMLVELVEGKLKLHQVKLV